MDDVSETFFPPEADEDERVALYFMRHAQRVIAEQVLFAMSAAIDEMVERTLAEVSGREAERPGLRQIATTQVLNQLVNYLQQDAQAARRHVDASGQRQAAAYDDLQQDTARAWFTEQTLPQATQGDDFWVPKWADCFGV